MAATLKSEKNNLHAGCIVIATNGVLIRGVSGSGKSSLALKLIEQARANGTFSALVADDQTLLSDKNCQLIARCPAAIAGRSEIRGYGIADVPNLPSTIVHLVVELVSAEIIARMPDDQSITLSGIRLPLIHVPSRAIDQSLPIILAALEDLNRQKLS